MGFVLDRIFKQPLIKSAEIIADGYFTYFGDVDRLEGSFSIQISYENLSGTLSSILEVSLDGLTWVPIDYSQVDFTDPSGTHIYDISSTGINKIRVAFSGGGSMQLNTAILNGSRRH